MNSPPIVNSLANAALNETLFPLTDHLGSVRDPVDDGKHTQYDGFGRITDEVYFDRSGAAIAGSHAKAVDQLDKALWTQIQR